MDDRKTNDLMVLARVVAVFGQAATFLVTWPLWTQRDFPPELPIIAIDLPWATVMLASLVVVLTSPRLGVPIHLLVYALSVIDDQIRLQPYFVTMAVIMIGALPYTGTRMFTRAYLLGVWGFSGLHKLIAFRGYMNEEAMPHVLSAMPWMPWKAAFVLSASVPLMEIAIAVLLFNPRMRRLGVGCAILLHAVIIVTLVLNDYNHSVWPWNVVLAVAGFCFFYHWTKTFQGSIRPINRLVQAGVVAALSYPIGYYAHLVEANLAYVLYSPKLGSAVHKRSGETVYLADQSQQTTGAFIPPQHRLHVAVFRKTGEKGDTLILHDPRPFATRERKVSFD